MSSQRRTRVAERIGQAVTALCVLALTASGSLKVVRQAQNVEYLIGRYGYPDGALVPIGLVELLCVALYAVPKTNVLGAVLLTGYLGGAIATHVRLGEAFVTPAVLAGLVWLGLALREPRLRALLPLRRP